MIDIVEYTRSLWAATVSFCAYDGYMTVSFSCYGAGKLPFTYVLRILGVSRLRRCRRNHLSSAVAVSIGVFLRVFIDCITIIGDVIVRTLFRLPSPSGLSCLASPNGSTNISTVRKRACQLGCEASCTRCTRLGAYVASQRSEPAQLIRLNWCKVW